MISPVASHAELICSGFGSSQFRVAGSGSVRRGLLEEMDTEVDPYITAGQTALQRSTLLRVTTRTVADLGLAAGVTILLDNELTCESDRYRISDIRREGDGATAVLHLRAA